MIGPAEVRRIRALQQKKVRALTQRFLVQGRKVVVELLGSAVTTEAIYATADAAAWIRDAASARGVSVIEGLDHELAKIGTFESGNELVAVALAPAEPPFAAVAAKELILALDGIHDPRNMGGLLRIADWFGITRLVCSPDCMEIYNPKVVQSSMGSVFRVAVRYTPLVEELAAHQKAGAHVLLADMDGTPVYEAAFATPAVLVLGSESHGLSAAIRALGKGAEVISIPRVGKAESLNVAMAATALCAEFVRRQGRV